MLARLYIIPIPLLNVPIYMPCFVLVYFYFAMLSSQPVYCLACVSIGLLTLLLLLLFLFLYLSFFVSLYLRVCNLGLILILRL